MLRIIANLFGFIAMYIAISEITAIKDDPNNAIFHLASSLFFL